MKFSKKKDEHNYLNSNVKSKNLIIFFVLMLIFNTINVLATDTKPKKNTIKVALLLDTSNSMDGLINQAKTQLWGNCK